MLRLSASNQLQETKAYQAVMALKARQQQRKEEQAAREVDNSKKDAVSAEARRTPLSYPRIIGPPWRCVSLLQFRLGSLHLLSPHRPPPHCDPTKTHTPPQVKRARVILGTVVTSCLGVYRTVKAAAWAFTDDVRFTAVDVAGSLYGDQVADVTGHAVDALRNVASLALNMDAMPSGAANIALNVAKESGLDIIALEEWLLGEVLFHSYVDLLSPLTTWDPHWLVIRTTALVIYPASAGQAIRPSELLMGEELEEVCEGTEKGVSDGRRWWYWDLQTKDGTMYRCGETANAPVKGMHEHVRACDPLLGDACCRLTAGLCFSLSPQTRKTNAVSGSSQSGAGPGGSRRCARSRSSH